MKKTIKEPNKVMDAIDTGISETADFFIDMAEIAIAVFVLIIALTVLFPIILSIKTMLNYVIYTSLATTIYFRVRSLWLRTN